MASNEAKFIVTAEGKNIKPVTDQTDKLGRTAQRTKKAYEDATKATGDFYNTQAKGIIGTANSTKSFSKLAETMHGSSGIVGAYATLAANVFAVTAAFNALRSAARVEQVQVGLEAMSNRLGTTLSVAAQNLREISGMTLTTEQAFRSTAQIAAGGFGTKSISDLGKVARDTSFALGRDMTDSMDRLTRGVVKLEPELLDELGLMTKLGESSSTYAAKLNKSVDQLSNFEKRQGFLNAIVAEGTAKFGGLGEEAGNVKNLDRLAATFADLTKNIFTLVNKAALPLAGIFSSKGVLLGGMLLFASTISKQLLPGLSDLSIKSAKAAEALTKANVGRITDIPTDKAEPKGMKALRRDIKKETADVQSYKTALESLGQQEEKLAAQAAAGGTARKRWSAEKISATYDEIEVLQHQQVTVRETLALEQEAQAKRTGASAIAVAGQKKVLSAYTLTAIAVKEYHASIILANQAAGATGGIVTKSMVMARTAFFAASIGVRAFGAALVSALGTIGLVISVVWALVEGIKYLIDLWTDPAVKVYKKALEEQETVLATLNDRYIEVARIQSANIPLAQKQAQAYKTMTNSVRENIEAYEKLRIAETAAFKDKTTVKAEDSAGFKALKELRDSGLPEVRRQIDEALGKRGLTGILENADAELSKSQLTSIGEVLTQDLRQGAVTLGDHINDIALAAVEASKAVAEFNRSMIPSTPYDNVATQIDAVAAAMGNVISNAAQSNDFSDRLTQSILSVGDGIRGFFSVGLQTDLKTFEKFDKLANDNAGKMDAGSLKIYRNAVKQKAILSETIALRTDEVFQVQALFAEAQKVSIETKSQIALEEARLKKLTSFKALAGSTIKLRIDAENGIIDLQKNQIRAQTDLVERQSEMTRQVREGSRAELEGARAYQTVVAAVGKENMENLTAVSKVAIARINVLNAEKQGLDVNSERGKQVTQEITDLREVLDLVRTIGAQSLSLRSADAQINAANIETQALNLQQTSQLVANAEAIAQNKATESEFAQKNLDIAKSQVTLDTNRLAITRKLEGRAMSLAETYNEMVRAQNQTTRLEKESVKNQAQATVANLMVDRQKAFEQGLTTEVALYDNRINQEYNLANLRMKEIDDAARLAILEKVTFDTQKEGLEMQRDALIYMEKVLSARSELLEVEREGAKIDREIARRRGGVASNDYDSKSEEIRAAAFALDDAKSEAGVRKAVITLEYALLEAKRQQTVFDLETQRTILASQGKLTAAQASQIENTLQIIKSSAETFDMARDNALTAVDRRIENLAKSLELLTLDEGRGNFSANILNSLREARTLKKEAGTIATAQTPEAKAVQTVVIPFQRATNTLVDAQNENTRVTAELTATMKEQQVVTQAATSATATAPAMVGSVYERLSQFKAWVERNYPGVRGELDHHGGATGNRRAIDFNIGTGNTEWNDSQKRAIFNAIAAAAKSQGLGTLWGPKGSEFNKRNVDGHLDHLHIDTYGSAAGTAVAHTLAPTVSTINSTLTDTSNAVEKLVEILPFVTKGTINDGTMNAANDNQQQVVTARSAAPISNLKDAVEELKVSMTMGDFNMLQMFQEMADQLGPEGQIVPAIMTGLLNITDSVNHFREVMADDSTNWGEKFQAGAAIAQQTLSMIGSVLQAGSDARIANIDREIAAEQRRDGKSAESVAKIQSLEKRKDAIARKSFNMNKKLMMAQAVISTAAAVAGQLAMPPVGPWNIALAAIMGAFGAAQLAIIAGTQYQSSANANFDSKSQPSTLTIGKRGDSVDVAKYNPNIGGELGYLRGSQGQGTNSSNYQTIGSAYGGRLGRGYGHAGFVVGEKGPEVINPDTPVTVRPMNDNGEGSGVRDINLSIHAIDAKGVHEMLLDNKGNLIDMFRDAANSNGLPFMEDVNTSHYKKSNGSGASRI